MKFYFLILMSMIGLLSCSKDNDLVYDFRLQTSLNVPPSLNTLETHYFFIRELPTFYKANLESRGISSEAVSLVNSSRGIFSTRFTSYDLAFIRLVTVSAISRKSGKRVEMFYREDVPFNEDSDLQMISSLGNLKEILAEETMDLEIRLEFRSFPPPGLTLQLDYGYLVQL